MLLRSMIKGGWARGDSLKSRESEESPEETEEVDYSFLYTNTEVQKVIRMTPVNDFIYTQHLKYNAHVCRSPNTSITKIMLFAKPTRS